MTQTTTKRLSEVPVGNVVRLGSRPFTYVRVPDATPVSWAPQSQLPLRVRHIGTGVIYPLLDDYEVEDLGPERSDEAISAELVGAGRTVRLALAPAGLVVEAPVGRIVALPYLLEALSATVSALVGLVEAIASNKPAAVKRALDVAADAWAKGSEEVNRG